MPNEFDHLGTEDRLKAENDFLKMKLMLEHGAVMTESAGEEIPDEVENAFLNNIIAFEKEFENRKTVKVFDKIGRPSHFRPVTEIDDADMEETWKALRDCLNQHGIDLGVCSPNITARELYRFTIEELFEHEMDDMNLSGWVTNFIYDEFHPDPVYDNTRLVEENLLRDIFRTGDMFFEMDYDDEFEFNNEHFPDFASYAQRIRLFKSLYEEIELTESNVDTCTVDGDRCTVSGTYHALARNGRHEDTYKGHFRVELSYRNTDYWYITSIKMEGFNP